ncbi:MAG TPA: aa3-type cytochrome c oxidase subunit IV [Sphingobium sp.]|nr:aa3-type cytochrome c oxidase subunit IV [Sphingobium sp.]
MSSEHDIRPAQKTYHGFLGLLKWGTIASVAVALLVIVLIA